MRGVVAIPLGDCERRQIAGAADRLGVSLSGFVRQAALQASAVVERKASVKAREEREAGREPGLSYRAQAGWAHGRRRVDRPGRPRTDPTQRGVAIGNRTPEDEPIACNRRRNGDMSRS